MNADKDFIHPSSFRLHPSGLATEGTQNTEKKRAGKLIFQDLTPSSVVELARMALPGKVYVSFHPMDVGLLGAPAVMTAAYRVAHVIEELPAFRLCRGRGLVHIAHVVLSMQIA